MGWLEEHLGFIPFFEGPASVTGRTMLVAGLVLAVMVLPIVSAVAREVFAQTPRKLQEGALALGATRWEMLRMTVLPVRQILDHQRRHARPRPGARGDDGGDDHPLGLRHRHLQPDQPGEPSTIAANIALDFPESSGLAINTLIASGLVLFAITLVTNLGARAIISRQNIAVMEAREPIPLGGQQPVLGGERRCCRPGRPTARRASAAASAAVLLALGAFSVALAWSSPSCSR